MSNYPDGAENDPNAPWNQVDEPEEEKTFFVTVEATLGAVGHAAAQEEVVEVLKAYDVKQISVFSEDEV
jgi:hypothetical protein